MNNKKFKLDLDPNQNTPRIKVLCMDISNFSQNTQFLICTALVFVFFLIYGYLQEVIFTIQGFKPYGPFLTLVQFGFYSIFGFCETRIRGDTLRRIPLGKYVFLAFLTLGTMGLSNSSVGYLNYPTQVIFKCCKLIPVMAGSILIQGKKYGPLDFSAAVLMCIGLTLFTLADSYLEPNFNTLGIIMISTALLFDAILGNVQEKYMKEHGASTCEVVFYSYGIGFLYILVAMLLTGDFVSGVQFFSENNPVKLYGTAFIFSVSGYLGIQIVLTLVRTCGAFAAVTVTTCRKAVTIAISFIFISKPFTFQYIWSGLVVVLGIYLNLYSKKHPITFTDFEVFLENWFRKIHLKFISRNRNYHLMSNV